MGGLNKFCLLFILIISGSLLSTSFAVAGRQAKFVSKLAADVDAIQEKGTSKKALNKEELRVIHERLLRTNTKDYGRSDPSPTLSKPHSKQIPN